MSGIFEGPEYRCPIVMGEIELSRTSSQDVVVDYPRDFLPKRLRFGRIPNQLIDLWLLLDR